MDRASRVAASAGSNPFAPPLYADPSMAPKRAVARRAQLQGASVDVSASAESGKGKVVVSQTATVTSGRVTATATATATTNGTAAGWEAPMTIINNVNKS